MNTQRSVFKILKVLFYCIVGIMFGLLGLHRFSAYEYNLDAYTIIHFILCIVMIIAAILSYKSRKLEYIINVISIAIFGYISIAGIIIFNRTVATFPAELPFVKGLYIIVFLTLIFIFLTLLIINILLLRKHTITDSKIRRVKLATTKSDI